MWSLTGVTSGWTLSQVSPPARIHSSLTQLLFPDDEYEERSLTRHVHFVRSSVRASNKRAKFSRMGSARLGEGWNRAVRDVCVTDIADEDHNDSIYEVIKPIESESDFEVRIDYHRTV